MDATTLFPTWHRTVESNLTTEIIESRVAAIETLLEIDELEDWLDITRLALGIPTLDKNALESFVQAFLDQEKTFPVVRNAALVKNLAACTLCFCFEQEDFIFAKELSYVIISAAFADAISIGDVPLVQFANRIKNEEIAGARVFQFDSADELNELDTIVGISSDSGKDVMSAVQFLLKSNNFLREEINVHWWLFGRRSSKTRRTFSSVNYRDLISDVALDLFDNTVFLSELPSAKDFLANALSGAKDIQKSSKATIEDIVNASHDEVKSEILSASSAVSLDFTPCLRAFSIAAQFDKGEDWAVLYSKHKLSRSVKIGYEIASISYQIYNELFVLEILKK